MIIIYYHLNLEVFLIINYNYTIFISLKNYYKKNIYIYIN
jgi:hypothetical protein